MRKELTNLNKTGAINDYLYYHLFSRIDYLPQNTAKDLIMEAQALTKMGVESEDDHKQFTYIRMHLKKIAIDIGGNLDMLILSKLASRVYHNRNSYPIDTIYNFYKAISHGMEELGVPINKSAYPVSIETYNAKSERDVQKWLQCMRGIYELVHRGYTYNEAFDIVTEHWDVMEKNDYKYWLKFYQSGEHMKYKTAEKTAQLGYQIPWEMIKVRQPDTNETRSDFVKGDNPPVTLRSVEPQGPTVEEIHKSNIDKRIQSIIGRLNAAEKLANNSEVIVRLKQLLDIDVGEWLDLLHKLKRSLVLTPIRNASSTILEDLIIREANRLVKNGKVNAGRLLMSIAQEPMGDTTVSDPSQSPMKTESIPTPIGKPGDVAPAPIPSLGGPPTEVPPVETAPLPALPPTPDASIPQAEPGSEAMNEFIDNLNLEYPEEADKGKADDSYAVDGNITVTAQEVLPPVMPATPEARPSRSVPERPRPHIQVEEADEDSFDLNNVKISDVVKRLELVSNVLKNREIPRQLAIVDLMLDKLGIAAFFPTLAEATRSSLESNQYMSTRVEDILGKLRGSLEPAEKDKIDLTPGKEERTIDKTLESVRQNLREEDRKQKELKDKRQELREQETATPEKPAKRETPKELTRPVNVEKTLPVAPPPAMPTR